METEPTISLMEAIREYRSEWNQRVAGGILNRKDTNLIDSAYSDNEGFIGLLLSQLGIDELSQEVIDYWNPGLSDPLSRNEFLDASVSLEKKFFNTWQMTAPKLASQFDYWTICNLVLLKLAVISPSYFLGKDSHSLDALSLDTFKSYKNESRRMLGRLGGETHEGYRSPFTMCSVARAWWRVWLSKNASQSIAGLSENDAHTFLNSSNPNWETLITRMINQTASLSDPYIRAAIIADMGNTSLGRDEFRALMSKVAVLGIGKHFNSMGPDLCTDLVSEARTLINN